MYCLSLPPTHITHTLRAHSHALARAHCPYAHQCTHPHVHAAQAGGSCIEGSILQAFDLATVDSLTDASVLAAVNGWVDASPANAARAPSYLGKVEQDASDDYTGASAIIGSYSLTMQEVFFESAGSSEDPLSDEWEAAVLCIFGIDADEEDEHTDCEPDDMIVFKANFRRSFGDEFGKAIGGDVKNLAIGYMLILVYLLVMLSGFDVVNSMIGMAMVALLIVGLSYGSCMGIGAFIGPCVCLCPLLSHAEQIVIFLLT